MLGIFSKRKALFFVSIALPLLFSAVPATYAAAPQFLLTWSANKSYVPPLYAGKVLPSIASPITASFELVSGGRVLNVKGYTVYWYLDGNLIAGGLGVQRVTFSPYAGSGQTAELKVQIPNYNGTFLIHTIEIPIVQPKIVLEAPYPGNQFSGPSVSVKALPYFFDFPPGSLSYAWSVNGTPSNSTENPDTAQINLPAGVTPGTTIVTALTATDPSNYFSAQSMVRLTYTHQL